MTRVLIIGGGVAGPAAALALHKAGIDVSVHEAYPVGGEDVGAFLTIMNNGMDALAAVDAAEAVEAVSFPATTVEFLDGTGRLLGQQQIAGQLQTGHDPRTMRRAALYRALTEQARGRGIPVSNGQRLVDAVVDGERIRAVFENGSSAVGDVLIGADGIHSRVRTLIDPTAPQPRYTGLNILYGYTDDPTLPASADAYRMIQGKRAFFGYTTSPQGETFWFARLPGPELTRIAGTTVDSWRRMAAEFFIADTTPSHRIIEATWEEIVGGNAYDVPSTPRWHRGPMVLVGDAAHAASPAAGQGASMALEDAVVLAKCLRDLPRDAAFAAYERIRRERVERLVAVSANDGQTRDSGDEVLAEQLNDRQQSRSWLYAHHIDWAEPVS